MCRKKLYSPVYHCSLQYNLLYLHRHMYRFTNILTHTHILVLMMCEKSISVSPIVSHTYAHIPGVSHLLC